MNKLPNWLDDQAQIVAAEQPVDLSDDQIQTIRDEVGKRYASAKNLTNQAIRELAYAIAQRPTSVAPEATAEDIRMLHSVAGYMRRDDSPQCAADLTNLALRLEAAQSASAADSERDAALINADEVIRMSDQSVRVHFVSARAASQFERGIRAAMAALGGF